MIIKLWQQNRKEITDLIINTGEEKTDGILPIEIPEVFFQVIKYDKLQPIYIQNKSNNDIEQAVEFKTYTKITMEGFPSFKQDMINYAEKLIEASNGNSQPKAEEKEAKQSESDVEEEEEEEELEIDTEG